MNNTDLIESTTAYMNDHIQEELSLAFLADRVSLSPYYFLRLFKQQIGLTPHDYLIAVRINHAKFLLKKTDLSIREISYRCGFSSESGFCTTFRKREHLTPSDYREFRR